MEPRWCGMRSSCPCRGRPGWTASRPWAAARPTGCSRPRCRTRRWPRGSAPRPRRRPGRASAPSTDVTALAVMAWSWPARERRQHRHPVAKRPMASRNWSGVGLDLMPVPPEGEVCRAAPGCRAWGAAAGVEEGEPFAARQPRGDVVGERVAALPDDDLGAVLAQGRCLRGQAAGSTISWVTTPSSTTDGGNGSPGPGMCQPSSGSRGPPATCGPPPPTSWASRRHTGAGVRRRAWGPGPRR